MLQKHVFNFLILITTESFKTISNIKKKIKNQKFISEDKRARSASRLVAIQVLYNYFLLDENIEDIIAKYTLSFESDLNDLFYINNFDREYLFKLQNEFSPVQISKFPSKFPKARSRLYRSQIFLFKSF